MNSYYSKLWKGNGMQRLRHYKSAAAPQATEDGVTILTGAQLQLGWAMNSASERIAGSPGDTFEQIAMDSKKDVFAT